MGTCYNCDTEITLGEERTNCDVCGEILFYHCNNCSNKFYVKDKETKKKLKECKLCGYFLCPSCGVCSWKCNKFSWEREILKILRPEITQGSFPVLLEKVKKIVSYFEEVKGSNIRMTCPERGVPISYAKNRIKNLLTKVEGFKVKDEEDRNAFIKRLEEITKKEIGTELSINNIKEKGSYGQEYRDAFNLLVCLGKLKIIKKRFMNGKEEIEYEVFIRCEKEPCPRLSQEDLIIYECEKCKKRSSKEILVCDKCSPYKKGKGKGQLPKIKGRLNDKDTCQLYRGSFEKKSDGRNKS